MAIGKIGTYATTDKTANYVGDALSNLGNVAFRDRQVKQQREDKLKDEKDKKDLEISTEFGKIKSDTTRFPTQNALIIDALHKAKNGFADKANQYKQGKISKIEYDTYKSNVLGNIDLIDATAKRINAQSIDYSKQLAEGKIHPAFAENAINFGGAYDNNRMVLDVNEDGTMFSTAYDEKDNILEKGDLSKLGQNAFAPIPNYDIDKDLQEFYKTYPPVLNEEIIGNKKIGTKGISPEIQTAIDAKVNALIKDKNTLAVSNYVRSGKANPNVTNESEIEETRKYLSNKYTSLYSNQKSVDEAYQGANYRAGRADQAYRKAKDLSDSNKEEQSFTTTPEIPLNFNQVGVVQGRDLVMNIGNAKSIPSLSFTNKNNGKIVNYTKVTPQKISRILKDGKYVYVTEISHLKPTKIYADGGEDLGGGSIAKKGDYLGVSDIQTSDVITLREANALSLLKSKTIKTKEDLRNIFPKEQAKSTNIKKEINRADLATKAKASGYSVKEYEALLIKNGVTIK